MKINRFGRINFFMLSHSGQNIWFFTLRKIQQFLFRCLNDLIKNPSLFLQMLSAVEISLDISASSKLRTTLTYTRTLLTASGTSRSTKGLRYAYDLRSFPLSLSLSVSTIGCFCVRIITQLQSIVAEKRNIIPIGQGH